MKENKKHCLKLFKLCKKCTLIIPINTSNKLKAREKFCFL